MALRSKFSRKSRCIWQIAYVKYHWFMQLAKRLTAFLLALTCTFNANAKESKHERLVKACVANATATANPEQTVAELRLKCEETASSTFGERIIFEEQAAANPFAIIPHHPNYILPVTYAQPREQPYQSILQDRNFDELEAKFQISIKYIATEDLWFDDLDLQFAFTATSWWQSYSREISAPFRETNYEPELIFNYNKPWKFAGISLDSGYLSINHQSNGQAGSLSRSWNRIIGGAVFSRDNIIWAIRAWWRVPEDQKDDPNDAVGDDNPNIDDFLGYGEVGILWQINDNHDLDIMLRNNLRSDNRGAVRIGWSFSYSTHLRGYIEYFNGYGESLIYYDQHISRLGIGVKLTDWL